MVFRVETTPSAERDAQAILEWLLDEQAGETGLRWFLNLEHAIESLSRLPKRCALALESERFPFEVRQLLYGRRPHVYRILFTIEGDIVYILHIRHGRRSRTVGHRAPGTSRSRTKKTREDVWRLTA